MHQPVSVVSQCSLNAWLWDWLVEISVDLGEAVAHLRRVRDDALYKYTVTLLYLLLLVGFNSATSYRGAVIAQICPKFRLLYTARSIWSNEGSKRVISRRMCLSEVLTILGVKLPKMKFWANK